MREEIKMPNMGYDMETGRLVDWYKGVGDEVARGEPLAEIETDKTNVVMESLKSGTVVELLAQPGDEVAVGGVLGYIESSGQ
jgi:pyruvate dehydrogenase E2 component (dihydrolipoamide acetyltransferase)